MASTTTAHLNPWLAQGRAHCVHLLLLVLQFVLLLLFLFAQLQHVPLARSLCLWFFYLLSKLPATSGKNLLTTATYPAAKCDDILIDRQPQPSSDSDSDSDFDSVSNCNCNSNSDCYFSIVFVYSFCFLLLLPFLPLHYALDQSLQWLRCSPSSFALNSCLSRL